MVARKRKVVMNQDPHSNLLVRKPPDKKSLAETLLQQTSPCKIIPNCWRPSSFRRATSSNLTTLPSGSSSKTFSLQTGMRYAFRTSMNINLVSSFFPWRSCSKKLLKLTATLHLEVSADQLASLDTIVQCLLHVNPSCGRRGFAHLAPALFPINSSSSFLPAKSFTGSTSSPPPVNSVHSSFTTWSAASIT